MAKLIFPARPNGLEVPVVIGLDGQTTMDLIAAGLPIPAPLQVCGEVDCGSNVTVVARRVLQQLGLTHGTPAATQTASGIAQVNLFSVSITVRGPQQATGPAFTLPTILVMDMPQALPNNVEVLVGLNVLLECNFLLEGPLRRFSFEF